MAIVLGVGAVIISGGAGVAWGDPPDTGDSSATAGSAGRASDHRGSRAGWTPRLQKQRTATPERARAARATRDVAPVAAAVRGSDPFAAFLNNTAPRLTATQTGQSPGGTVRGVLAVDDPDGDATGLAVTRAPAFGTVVLGGNGQFTYTPSPTVAHTGAVDSFDVTVSDAGAGPHLHGLPGLINLLTFGLIGAGGHTSTSTVRVTIAPFNNAPTATLLIDPPDPLTGTVTGRVLGSDPDGDEITYTGSAATPKGAVTVSPTGYFVFAPTASALLAAASPTATEADRQDMFDVTLADSYGGSTAVAVTVPIGRPAPATELSTFCGCTLMPADTVFHADVSALPVLARSEAWTALIGGTLSAAWGGTPWMGNTGGMPVNVVGPGHPTETVIFNRGYSTSGPSIDDRPYAIPDRPLVEGMPNVPAWDRHLLVFQEGTCVSQELYNVANGVELPAIDALDALGNAIYASQYGSAWIAEAGGHVDMTSPLYPALGWANASRLPYLPLILRPDDLQRGWIDHMLGITIGKDRGTGYSWPARAGDGTGANPDGVPMGTVFRLRADFDISSYSPATQVILRALKEHGAVVYDSRNAGQDGATLLAMSNGWSGTEYLTAQRELRTVTISAFEAVDVLSLAVDPATGWAVRSTPVV